MILARITGGWINPVFPLLIFDSLRWTVGKAAIAENTAIRYENRAWRYSGFQKLQIENSIQDDFTLLWGCPCQTVEVGKM